MHAPTPTPPNNANPVSLPLCVGHVPVSANGHRLRWTSEAVPSLHGWPISLCRCCFPTPNTAAMDSKSLGRGKPAVDRRICKFTLPNRICCYCCCCSVLFVSYLHSFQLFLLFFRLRYVLTTIHFLSIRRSERKEKQNRPGILG